MRGHTMYFDLAGKTEVIYEKITGKNKEKFEKSKKQEKSTGKREKLISLLIFAFF